LDSSCGVYAINAGAQDCATIGDAVYAGNSYETGNAVAITINHVFEEDGCSKAVHFQINESFFEYL